MLELQTSSPSLPNGIRSTRDFDPLVFRSRPLPYGVDSIARPASPDDLHRCDTAKKVRLGCSGQEIFRARRQRRQVTQVANESCSNPDPTYLLLGKQQTINGQEVNITSQGCYCFKITFSCDSAPQSNGEVVSCNNHGPSRRATTQPPVRSTVGRSVASAGEMPFFESNVPSGMYKCFVKDWSQLFSRIPSDTSPIPFPYKSRLQLPYCSLSRLFVYSGSHSESFV